MSLDGKIGSSPNAHLISSSPASTASPPMNNVSLGPAPLHATAAAPAESSSSSSSLPNTLETLDEPVLTTILRDLKRIGVKTKHVLIPKSSDKELRDWDLWGPLILCLLLASTLSIYAPNDQAAAIFAAVFVIIFIGSGVVTLNAKLLGGTNSFLQSVCVLGYSVAPLNIASILCHAWSNKWFHFALVIVAFLWSTRASIGFMAQLVPDSKRTLGVYPVILFYLSISWMILVQ